MSWAITSVCGDAGGAEAVAPVLERLRAQRQAEVRVLAYQQAVDVLCRRGLGPERLDESMQARQVSELLQRPVPALLLVGTSMNAVALENRFVVAARAMGVPSLAVLDFWVNYAARFVDGTTGNVCIPDRIAVMDERARREMIAAGFDPGVLVVTGQPALEDLDRWRDGFTSVRKQEVRSGWGVAEGEQAVLFVSQPLSRLYGSSASDPRYLGFHEQGVSSLLIAALEGIAVRGRRRVLLVMRPHPREDASWMAGLTSPFIRIAVSAEGEARDAALSADLVTGMNSMLLMEACHLGCPVVSLQPGLTRPDILPTNADGLSCAVYRAQDAEPALERWLNDDSRSVVMQKLRALERPAGATARVVEVIGQLIGGDPNA